MFDTLLMNTFLFQKKKPDWALGAKEGEGGSKTPVEEMPPEIEAN